MTTVTATPIPRQSAQEIIEQAAAQAREQAQAAREQAQAAREQAREQAQQAREQAQEQREAAQEARDAAREAQRAGERGEGERIITITTPDGKSITLSNPTGEQLAQLGYPVQVERPESDGPFVIAGISIVATAIVLLVALTQRYRLKMRNAINPALSNDLAQRLARMETGIESVAVEVERISEGQRFTTRLLSDRERVEVSRG